MQAFQFFINPILAKIVLVLLQYFKELCTQHTIASNAPIEKEKKKYFLHNLATLLPKHTHPKQQKNSEYGMLCNFCGQLTSLRMLSFQKTSP